MRTHARFRPLTALTVGGLFVSRQPAHSSTARRRAASAFVVPVIVTGILGAGSPAIAATTTASDGICNGVVNQYAHRGTVQENLLKAAARKNAKLIAKLQADRTALQTQSSTLTSQITTAEQALAALEAEGAKLDADIAAAESELATLTADQTNTATAITAGEKALADAPRSRPMCRRS